MITTPIVFVLGAGASVDFDFPVGKELLQRVVEDLRSTTQIRDNVLASGFSAKEVDEFSDALRFSAEWSIDAFLEKRPAFMNIGKAAMERGRQFRVIDGGRKERVLSSRAV
jgi:hypothetical protein